MKLDLAPGTLVKVTNPLLQHFGRIGEIIPTESQARTSYRVKLQADGQRQETIAVFFMLDITDEFEMS